MNGDSLNSFLPILIMLVIAILFAIFTIIASNFIGKKTYEIGKLKPYECGVEPTGDAHFRFDVKFYLVAIFFLLFDIEALFLFPWAVVFSELGLFGFIEMFMFIIILVIGLLYVWKKGALRWE
ncbi:MAG: NADH-quinone oxidoreductase subunit A [Candidatus Acidulodesulfobacterium ferriphilum]|uniref:NADH-quinone oxidoreductase subunit A n=1 Tax=Candidatus Acidulodesulfobacterium ferriphilum TaxID=2597223 RepID=A0A519BE51_9DELT|nr:NADH-quinone oxidoreductase subunit A [Deltaproteobacteria bacterium]RZD15540.1 MAG: NADH-quinone oxidoreductase subunit A [Candidatus Acidulodesulfobacterium ferriphilum]